MAMLTPDKTHFELFITSYFRDVSCSHCRRKMRELLNRSHHHPAVLEKLQPFAGHETANSLLDLKRF